MLERQNVYINEGEQWTEDRAVGEALKI